MTYTENAFRSINFLKEDQIPSNPSSEELWAVEVAGSGNSLFDFKWSDHELDDMSWVCADNFTWLDGTVYTQAYEHLATDIEDKALQSETIGSITVQFYLADDGHKICPVNQETNVSTIYTNTGVAWYYIIDETNTRVKLPRVNPNKELLGTVAPVVGNGYGLTLTNGDQVLGLAHDSASATTPIGGTNQPYTTIGTSTTRQNTQQAKTLGVPTKEMIGSDLSKSGLIADLSNETGIYKGHKYLYFYVGQFSKSATEQTVGLNAELFNGKVDIDMGNVNNGGKTEIVDWAMKTLLKVSPQRLVKYADIASSTSTYTAPIDGLLRVKIGAVYAWALYINGSVYQQQDRNSSDSCVTTWITIPVFAGDVLTHSGNSYHFDGGALYYLPTY